MHASIAFDFLPLFYELQTCEFLDFLLVGLFMSTQIAALASSLRTLADMKEPIGEVLKRTEVRRMLMGNNLTLLGGIFWNFSSHLKSFILHLQERNNSIQLTKNILQTYNVGLFTRTAYYCNLE